MDSIQDAILEQFLSKLAELPEFPDERVHKLRELFQAAKKPKAADIVEILSSTTKDAIP